MAFTVIIDEDRAREILCSIAWCDREGAGGDLSFLLIKIKEIFPDLLTIKQIKH